MTKRLISALLCAIICITCFAGCGKDDGTPDGMFSCTIEGEPFILYVPDGWSDNCDSGISSAHYGLNVIATARYYTSDVAGQTLTEYTDRYIASLSAENEGLSIVRKTSKLGKDTAAERIEYDLAQEGTSADSKAKIIQYFCAHEGGFVMLSFYCDSAAFSEYAEVFEQIRAEFVLRKGSVDNEVVTDKKTPEGMKLASSDLQYKFYVPLAWVANQSEGFSSAYYPKASKPNVTVTAYSLSTDMSVEEYFESCEEQYETILSGYEFIGSSERKVSDCDAVSYIYKTEQEGTQIKIMQTVFIFNSLAYSITYTAHETDFDAHTGDVVKMLDAFVLR